MNLKDNNKIVFFCSEVIGYTMAMFKAIKKLDPNKKLYVVFQDKNVKTKFQLKNESVAEFYPRSTFSTVQLYNFLLEISPRLVYLPGWMDKGYIVASKRFKKNHSDVNFIAGIDDQWRNTLRQKVGVIYFRFAYRKLFDVMWVAGKPQYHFAQRMGYDHHEIISNLYSADESIFNRKASFTKRFIFVGRFDPVKGIFDLIKEYEKLDDQIKKEWPLVIIGDGPLRDSILEMKSEFIIILPFMQPERLRDELLKGGVYCLTGYFEQWSVAVHEMALLGLPLLLSSVCGAATEFLISGYNGKLYNRLEKDALFNSLSFFTTLSDEDLIKFGNRSSQLGKRINSEQVAASFLSVGK